MGVQVAALQAAKLAKAREEEERVARQAKQQEIARRKEQAKARAAADALAKQQQRCDALNCLKLLSACLCAS